MAIELVTQYLPYVDELFSTESKKSMLTNQDFSWAGAKTVKVYKISTADMNDYGRHSDVAAGSRYGQPKDLDATTETMTLRKDRSFTFVIDKLDIDETGRTLASATALARQIRQVVIPEIDTYVYGEMCKAKGHTVTPAELTADNIYDEITKASLALDDAEAPESGRVLVVTPNTLRLMKKCKEIIMETDIGNDMRLKGVVGILDGADVIKVPANRLPEKFGFMLAHKVATVAPVKLEDYRTHSDPPGISGDLVEGRICYDAFILDNKQTAIYYQELTK